jgi:Uma2 family endonuclease
MLVEMVSPEELARLRPLARADYERMGELGMFDNERVELLRGVVVTMSPIGWLHGDVVSWFTENLVRQLDITYQVRPQCSFPAGEWSMPEPDVAIARKDPSRRAHPTDLFLVIEVADSSLKTDRGVKRAIYAEAGVPEYWIVDVNAATVEVCTDPIDGVYTQTVVLRDGDVLRPTQLPGVALAVAEIPR